MSNDEDYEDDWHNIEDEEDDNEDEYDTCPECEEKTLRTACSGVECVNPDCGYWFCF